MRQLFFVLILLTVILVGHGQSRYNSTFKDIDGKQVRLANLAGKKLLFIIAPLSAEESVLLNQLDSFQQKYGSNVRIIGIMSKDDGYDSTNKSSIKSLYQNKGIEIILTEGMDTRRSAGASQAPLLKWLTDMQASLPNNDAEGTGTKFFISSSGRLIAVLPSAISLGSSTVDQIINQN